MTIDVPPDDALPADVYPESRNRLPLLERDALDDDGKRLYDIATSGTLIAGLQGPLRVFGAQKLQGYVSLMSEYVATAMFLTVFDQQLPPGRRSTLTTRRLE